MKKIIITVSLVVSTLFIVGCTQKQEAYVPTQTIIKAMR